MKITANPGLGELLRHLTALVDQGAEQGYRELGMDYRPRYTPLMRALAGGEQTIGEITRQTCNTQGAVSQTVALMEKDGLIRRRPGSDARQTTVSLTPAGKRLLKRLENHWQTTFMAIESLEKELGVSLRAVLAEAIDAMERKGFSQRLREVQVKQKATLHVRK